MSVDIPGEGFPEINIAEQIGEIPEGFDTTKPLFEVLDQFQEARSVFLAACCSFASDPSEDNKTNVGLSGTVMLKSFQSSIDTITQSEPDEDARINMIANLMVTDDDERVSLFRDLTHSENFTFLRETGDADQTFEEALRESIAEYGIENLAHLVKGFYFKGLEGDVDNFVQLAVANYRPAPEDRKKVIARTVGKHALDVAKVAAGTALAIWATRRRHTY